MQQFNNPQQIGVAGVGAKRNPEEPGRRGFPAVQPRPPGKRSVLGLFALLFASQTALAQEEDFPPGLLARYESRGVTIERIDPDVQFVWGEGAPDARIPAEKFSATWTGQLLLREETTYRFHVYVVGEVSVSLDDEVVLTGRSGKPTWVSSKPLPLSFGEKTLKVTYRKTGEDARVQLFWSSDLFELAPVPSHVLFRDGPSPKLSAIERGRRQFEAHRCAACHRRENETPPLAAPDLTHIRTGTNPAWLVRQLQNPIANSPHAKMPRFGFSEEDAEAVVAFLWSVSKDAKLDTPPKAKDAAKDARQGQILLRATGCLACHTVDGHGQQTPYGGGDLTKIGAKRSAKWLYTWLSKPARLNPAHRMPVFRLSSTERRQLAAHLASLGRKSEDVAVPSAKDVVEKGRRLVRTANCAACHAIPGETPNLEDIPDLTTRNAETSCLQEEPNLKSGRPAFPQADAAAINAFLASRTAPLAKVSDFERGRLLLERRNCTACHPRGTSKGFVPVAGKLARLDEAFGGKAQNLIPPHLTAVGDKLKDEALIEAISGKQDEPRLDWLTIRMPRFEHDDVNGTALLSYLIGHDRIPDGAPRSEFKRPAPGLNKATPAELVHGHTLVGPRGLSCIACHQIGDYVPKNVAHGTRGSDLLLLGERMRPDFFIRWCRDPLRIVPGIEMPSFVKPVPGILDERVDTQLVAIWNALNDERFTPPTNPSAVEQFFVVKPGQRPRIVRDVFAVSKQDGGGAVARAFAVGFENGHNLLLDLDTFTLRQWTYGDLARQRTIGKSWYWDMAGVPIAAAFEKRSDFALRGPDGTIHPPRSKNGTVGRLLRYASDDSSRVSLEYLVNLPHTSRYAGCKVEEVIRPPRNSQSGLQRKITVSGIPSGYDLLVAKTPVTDRFELASVEADSSPPTVSVPLGDGASYEAFVVEQDGKTAEITIRYSSRLEQETVNLKPLPVQRVEQSPINSVPGFNGVRLPLPASIMPTAICFRPDGTMAFTSLKGNVYLARDTDGDGVEDTLALFEEGLSAPYGIIADGEDLIVSHKPELIRLKDRDGDGRADYRQVVATGWGFNDNYHDWVCGIVRDEAGNFYVGLGSDYAQKGRPKEQSRWRGKVLKISPAGKVTPMGHALRYPTGLAMNAAGDLFASDNQGVGNTFNEINHIVEGRHYGVPSLYEEVKDAPATRPAVQVPHPMTRSVNGLFVIDKRVVPAWDQHIVGCEYNEKLLMRFSYEKVGGELQGAAYYLSLPNYKDGNANFLGPLCGAVSPKGEIYVGSIYDSGWLGGRNTGEIVKLKANGTLPAGIRELTATPDGFQITFTEPVDAKKAADPDSYTISGYTRIWQGSYATPDSGRYRVKVEKVEVAPDGRSVTLHVDKLKERFVYDVSVGSIARGGDGKLWPSAGHYTMNRIPK